MKLLMFIFWLLLVNQFCNSQPLLHCNHDVLGNDSMRRAWYPYQLVDSVIFKNHKRLIIADINNKPQNFISSEERTYNRLALDDVEGINSWDKFEVDSATVLPASYYYWDSIAKKEHEYANNMDMAIWLQNTSTDTILFPQQDGSLIGLIEAKNKEGSWKPVQYWWFSWCGNSYWDIVLPPKNSFQIGLNNRLGEIQTIMRLKIHGHDTIYYSNEFNGWISENSFNLTKETIDEMIEDSYRISFLDTVHYGIAEFPDPPEIIIFEEN